MNAIRIFLIALAVMSGSVMSNAGSSDEFDSLFAKCSSGDISVLREGLKSTENHMMTSPGSPNAALWSALAKVGYMKAQPLPESLEALKQMGAAPLIFSVTAEGQKAIPKLFPQLGR